MALVLTIIYALLGTGMLCTGWSAARLGHSPPRVGVQDAQTLRRRSRRLRYGKLACFVGGAVMLLLAGSLLVDVLAV